MPIFDPLGSNVKEASIIDLPSFGKTILVNDQTLLLLKDFKGQLISLDDGKQTNIVTDLPYEGIRLIIDYCKCLDSW